MKRIMRAFKLNEISAVDRPAQAHATVVIMKRDFSASERRSDAKSGAAMPDGSFPIENAEDLANARRLAGKAKDPAAARAHIASRAKALGLSKLDGLIVEYLDHNEESAMDVTFSKADIDGAVVKAVTELRKEFETKLTESAEKLAKAEAELVKAKGKSESGEGSKDGGHDDDDDGDGAKGGEVKGKMKKIELPEEIQKALDEAKADKIVLKQLVEEREVARFAKRASELGIEGHGETLRKAFSGQSSVEVQDAIFKLEALIKGLAAQVTTGKIFAEFGSNQSNGGATAADEINVQAAAYREGQIKIGKKCTPQQAFTAVYTDPAYAELKKRYDAEEMKKRHAA